MPRALEPLGERGDERLHRLLEQALVVGLARLEPVAVVVLRELGQEVDGLGSEAGERAWSRWPCRILRGSDGQRWYAASAHPGDHRRDPPALSVAVPMPVRRAAVPDPRLATRSSPGTPHAAARCLPADDRPVRRPRLGGDGPADPGGPRRRAHWERFMARFPTVQRARRRDAGATSCARGRASGYNRRALALQRAARVIVEEHGGGCPDTVEALEALPGVGPYTARAVAAIAFGRPVGRGRLNVRRVLGRVVGGRRRRARRGRAPGRRRRPVPPDRPGDWTHALMDVGATRLPAAPAPVRRRARRGRGAGTPPPPAGRRRPSQAAPPPATARRPRFPDDQPLAPRPHPRPAARRAGRRWVALDAPIGAHDRRRGPGRGDRAWPADGVLEIAPDDRRTGPSAPACPRPDGAASARATAVGYASRAMGHDRRDQRPRPSIGSRRRPRALRARPARAPPALGRVGRRCRRSAPRR